MLGVMSFHTFLNFLLTVLNLCELNLSHRTMHFQSGGTHTGQWVLFMLLGVVWKKLWVMISVLVFGQSYPLTLLLEQLSPHFHSQRADFPLIV